MRSKYEKSELGDEIHNIAVRAVSRITDDEKVAENTASYIRMRVHTAVNDSLEQHKILKVSERSRVAELKKRINFIKKNIEERDPVKTEEIRQKLGDKYVDFAKLELTALQWAVEFIEERAL